MTGWRAYSLGAWVGIVAWAVLEALADYVVNRRRGDRSPLTGYLEGPLMAAIIGAPLASVLGLLVAEFAD